MNLMGGQFGHWQESLCGGDKPPSFCLQLDRQDPHPCLDSEPQAGPCFDTIPFLYTFLQNRPQTVLLIWTGSSEMVENFRTDEAKLSLVIRRFDPLTGYQWKDNIHVIR